MTDPAALASPPRRIVLVAGPSGSGKGVMTQRSGLPLVPLDEFYRDGDDTSLPHRFGIVDWDDPASWNVGAALEALTALAHAGAAEIPEYSISLSRRTGTRSITLEPFDAAPLIVAEGIFAAELIAPLREAGLLADALVVDRPAPLVFGLRLARDLSQSRKPPLTLVRRGWGLARDQRGDVARWCDAGMQQVGLREGVIRLKGLADTARAEARHRAGTGSTDSSAAAPLDHEAGRPEQTAKVPAVLTIAAVCFLREGPTGLELFAVRKRDTESFMQAGGKLEPGESAREAAVREVIEELDVVLEEDDLELLGEFEAPAANEDSTIVRASVFVAPSDSLPRDVAVQAELEDCRWFPLEEDHTDVRLAPLMTDHIVPRLRELLS
ncbi:uridylate kinase [Brachybacterium endophyticum]|uniref:Uridylate kinase n=1 Tax=Brachybacterium endophyticum TaxID=2182385 RepID=A0A2U2RGL3_9MICO|nr:NUDIX domain-containing protein [Brachybacterium endophyticum]PWH05009.1 uridylate kinase [Brachybacterium endophyticum]